MPDAPTTWLTLFDEYHRIVVGAGDLLRDADRLMAQRDYESAHSLNTVGTESSFHMDAPEKWTAGWFVRFYRNDARAGVVPYVAIFLHDRGGNEDYPQGRRLADPLVVAGAIRSVTADGCKWAYWNCKWWFWSGGEVGGPPVVHQFEPGNKDGQASNHSFALRLEDVTDLDALRRLVIDRLATLVADVG